MANDAELGYLESSQLLTTTSGRDWSPDVLLAVAERSSLRNTGWPIGLVIRTDDVSPVPTVQGVELRINQRRAERWTDYWSFRRDGSYYFMRLFEEEHESPSFQTSEGHPERALWFDMRIWRIAEVLLHSAALYRELDIPPDEPYTLEVSHLGLKDREFWTTEAGRFIRRGHFCREQSTTWRKEVTQDYILSNVRDLTAEVANEVFVLFDFMRLQRETIDQITDRFLKSRL